MIRSMTGFGRGSVGAGPWAVEARLKTVNHRYLELRIRGLEEREELELQARRLLEEAFARGRVELLIELEHAGEGVTFDLEAARRYYQGLQELCQELELEGGVRVSDLIALGALRPEEPEEELWPLLEQAIAEAISQALTMRSREGERLRCELEGYLAELEGLVGAVEARAPQVKLYHKERLRQRVEELLEFELDEVRLEEEAVLFAERADITEELARLRSHLAAAREAIGGDEPAGRVLDFLAQEMFREVNTISAKAREGEILQRTVAMRAEIERFREQVRNIE
ncbi:MAG: YicC/YloC family endoribonuclease [Candidatus Bipolaricaulia bacterium]